MRTLIGSGEITAGRCVAVDGRHESRVDLGSRQLRRSRLDSGLAALGSGLHSRPFGGDQNTEFDKLDNEQQAQLVARLTQLLHTAPRSCRPVRRLWNAGHRTDAHLRASADPRKGMERWPPTVLVLVVERRADGDVRIEPVAGWPVADESFRQLLLGPQ